MQRSALYVLLALLLASNGTTGWLWWNARETAPIVAPSAPVTPEVTPSVVPPPPPPSVVVPADPKPVPKAKPKAAVPKKQPGTKSVNCAQIRWYLETFSIEQLEAMARQFGVTDVDRERARKCIEGGK